MRKEMIGRDCEEERVWGMERRRERDKERGVKMKRKYGREGNR